VPLSGRLGHYDLLGLLGVGGMGEVYRAADTKLGRDVALKVLPPALGNDPERLSRFQREAQALAALDHPGIVTVYSVEQAKAGPREEDVHFLTMQLVEGQSLDRMLPAGGFPVERFLEIAAALSDALAAAHEKGIVHRDLKLANVMATADGNVKVLDFGIAKAMPGTDPGDATLTAKQATAVGVVMGTPAYISPEQIEGRGVQASSDLFSLGVVMYEMATGRRPFQGDTEAVVMSSILRDTPPPASQVKTGLPKAIDDLIARCLDKNSTRRPSARTVTEELRRLQTTTRAARSSFAHPRVLVPAMLVLVAVLAGVGYVGWSSVTRNRAAVFAAESLPRIEALARDGKYLAAFELARAVERDSGTQKVSEELWDLASTRVSVASDPTGSAVTVRPFGSAGNAIALGKTPLEKVRVPRGALHWRVEAPSYVVADLVTGTPGESLRFDLRPEGAPDRDMVRIPGADVRLWALGGVKAAPLVPVGAFLIDRYEVTNRAFAAFVAAGGYTREEYWTHPFRDGSRTLSFADAMVRFKDSTGRPGPATWKLGSYPDGEDDFAVHGVSWYEAAAYAAYAGKELPTIYHWYLADTANDLQLLPGLVLSATNHEGAGPRRASASGSMSAYGAIDMAGNVREWSANASEGSTRVALGGAWSDPAYQYLFPEIREEFDRSPGNGLRCIKRLDSGKDSAAAPQPLAPFPALNRATERPVSDAEYVVFTRFFERKPVPLEPRIETTDQSSPHWIKQKVSFAAGYGGERMMAWLYLPRAARPPYQVVIYMGGAGTFYRRSSATEKDIFGWNNAEYLIRGGRAVLIPIWKGSYERSDGFQPLETEWPSYREHVIQWVSEIRQSIDYLQSRDDVRRDAIAYQGSSNGAIWAPIFMALEPRIKTAIVLFGGLLTIRLHETPMPPEIDALNYAPRAKQPVLMMNGRHDAIFAYETSQRPLFNLFGTAAADKRHLVFPGGHSSFGWTNDLIKEGLDWLDNRFGQVTR